MLAGPCTLAFGLAVTRGIAVPSWSPRIKLCSAPYSVARKRQDLHPLCLAKPEEPKDQDSRPSRSRVQDPCLINKSKLHYYKANLNAQQHHVSYKVRNPYDPNARVIELFAKPQPDRSRLRINP